ncbi:hypothetical protein B0H65DRAFT_335759 [Neurospora tetraspora]|uniref:Uncharacterized protein n=1 Tax=Neurospora tetraspora TaxID=94610 RepID=A0AAE0MKC0_9PEZI|nr:hypothetical protein B0H65DRAFT_335759 [Neurospora tetraspora]
MPYFSMLRRTPRRRNSEFAKPADATVVTVTEDVLGGTGNAVAEGLGLGGGRGGGGHGGGGRFGGLGLGLTFNNSDKTNNNTSTSTFNSNESSRRTSIDGNDNGRDIQTTTNEKKKERRGSRRELFLQDIRSRLCGKLPPSSNNTSSPSSGTSTPHQESPKVPRGRAASQPPIPISQYREGGEGRGGEQRGERQGMGTIREAVSKTLALIIIQSSSDSYSNLFFSFSGAASKLLLH